MKDTIKKIFQIFGYTISQWSRLEDAFEMQQQLFANSKGNLVIFDVGAYTGTIALKYNEFFPNSKIYCFEPFPNSYKELVQNISSYKNIVTVNKGFGEKNGTSTFHSNRHAPTNSVLETDYEGVTVWGAGYLETIDTIDVDIITFDDYLESNNINHVDILKLDVQGSEYFVLKGAEKSLKQGKVKLIYTEIITMPTYKGQKSLDEIVSLLRSYGYSLFNFYNYDMTADGELRQIDAIFIKSK